MFCCGGWGQDMGSDSSFDKKPGPPHPWCGNRHAHRGVQRRQGGEPEDPIKQQHPKC